MPPSARKSSVGAARRATQKSHVPYRGDDPTVGRRTGLSVTNVPRGSDGFEPFDKLIDEHAPARLRKKKRSIAQDDEEEDDEEEKDEYDDGDGEMSMDVDSPIQNYANTRLPNTPRGQQRPISRTSEVDFDRVPSPRTHSSARRSTPGPSRLAPQQQQQDDDDDDDFGGGGNDTYDAGDRGGDDYGAHNPGDSPRQLSFTEMDTRDDDDEEDEEEQEEPPVSSPKRGGKGKARAIDLEVEDEIARGMDDVDMNMDMAPQSDEEDPPPPPKSPPKKAPAKTKPAPAPKSSSASSRRKENRDIPPGVRHSTRKRIYPPLEWWRNERVEFGGRDPAGGRILVPRIKAVIRIPKDPVVPLGKHARGARKTSVKPASKVGGNVKVVEKIVERVVQVPGGVINPEEGWDDETEGQAVVKAYPGDEDVTRRIAFTAKMFIPSAAANNEWFFQKIFGDGDFIAAGQIVIPPKGRKPSKPSKDNTFIFFVIEGAVNLKVCETSLIVASGGMFMIPRGNTYFIENIGDRDAKLFFTQARKMREGEEDEAVARSDGPVARAASVAGGGVQANGKAKEKETRRGVSMHV
ncbi:Mif2/CENP-C like-domain-containing protein [Mycena filopes]|nr:Mif2/CENP-C like-domain-containing protein [Mycena filopes]